MADPTQNAPGSAATNPGQPASGQTRGLAARVGAANGSAKPSAGPANPAATPVANRPKGGRRTFEEDLAIYLAKTGQTVVPNQTAGGVAPAQVVPPPHLVSPEFVGEVTVTLLKGVEAYRVRSVALRVKTLCGDMALAKEYAESSAAPPGCIDTIGKGMVEIAKKYPAMLQWMPELTVASALGMWAKKDLENMQRLDAFEKRILETMKKATVTEVKTTKGPAATTPEDGGVPAS